MHRDFHKIPRLSRRADYHYIIYKNASTFPNLSQKNLVYAITPRIFKIYSNIILPQSIVFHVVFFFGLLAQSFVYISHLFY